ncbi:MAG: AbrB family transcriptional regulator [Lachnospiraceae bacterium]|nr:AbrB family transcriptional regulator [Lachnospiraceae bacterium]
MDLIIRLIITIGIGVTGGILAKKLKFIPAAFMLGSLIFVTVFNLTTEYTYFPYWIRILTQIVAGAYLGLNITKESLHSIKTVFFPIAVIMFQYTLFTLFFGYIMHKVSGTDIVTSLYCFAPGGISDLGIIADSLGGDVAVITFMQLIRLITVFGFYPFFYNFIAKKGIIKVGEERGKREPKEPKEIKESDITFFTKERKIKGTFVALSFCSIGGLTGYFLGLPAGAMVFSMLFAVIINLLYRYSYMPIQMRFFSQMLSGVYLGLKITKASLIGISNSMGSVVIMLISIITTPIIFGYITHKITKLDLGTSLFACTPGGMSEMTILADDMGFDFVKVSIIHLARMLVVISIFPYIINAFISLIS